MRIPRTSANASSALAIEAIARDARQRRVGEDRGRDVEAGLDRHRHSRREVAIQAQRPEPERFRALAPRRVAGAIAEVLHVVDVQAQQVADAVREQQRDHAVLRQLDRVAAQDAEIDEARGERLAREHVDVAIAAARRHRGDRLGLC